MRIWSSWPATEGPAARIILTPRFSEDDQSKCGGVDRRRALSARRNWRMKITDVTVESYEWPRPRPIRNGMFVYTTVRLDIVTVHTDDGIKGVGLGSGGAGAGALMESLKPGVIGQDPMNVERIWHQLWVPKLVGRRRHGDQGHQRHRYRHLGPDWKDHRPAGLQTPGRIHGPDRCLHCRRLLRGG